MCAAAATGLVTALGEKLPPGLARDLLTDETIAGAIAGALLHRYLLEDRDGEVDTEPAPVATV